MGVYPYLECTLQLISEKENQHRNYIKDNFNGKLDYQAPPASMQYAINRSYRLKKYLM